MDTRFILELFGYTASALIAISLMMSSIKRLRLLNLVGAAGFAIYGLLIHAFPVVVLNGLIVMVNIYHLRRLLRAKQVYQLLELRLESDFLAHFLKFYDSEIKRVLPDFVHQPMAGQVVIFILRDCTPVGVFIAEHKTPASLQVRLDFVIPRYRNLHLGRFLFVERADIFRARGIREIVIQPRTREFGAYLWEVGFEPTDSKKGTFRIWVADKPV